MDKFLESQNLPRLNHEKIENLKRLINSKELEAVNQNLPIKQNLESDEPLTNSTKHLKKD